MSGYFSIKPLHRMSDYYLNSALARLFLKQNVSSLFS